MNSYESPIRFVLCLQTGLPGRYFLIAASQLFECA